MRGSTANMGVDVHAGHRFGAIVQESGVLFQIWASTPGLELIIEAGSAASFRDFRERTGGVRELYVPGLRAGSRYGYKLDGQGPFPDPASRYQPDGVHGLSEVVDPSFPWTDTEFAAAPWEETTLYELHCGTFTSEGTFRAAAEKLSMLRDLGVTAIELMPAADFAGSRNWGYDGVSLYAPSRAYGRPEDLRALVNRAHEHGLAVYLDVVYNHLGPDGAYHRLFHPLFYSADIQTPWGDALNFDEPGSEAVRAFFIDNGIHWLTEYHIDGLRLDAAHAIEDRSAEHFIAEFARAMHQHGQTLRRRVDVIAEDSRNMVKLLVDPGNGGYGVDAVWADDFHHQIRARVAGDNSGYYADYRGTNADIVRTLGNGWFYDGQFSRYLGRPRGSPTDGIDRSRFIICIQNHDQIGNRALGERLNHQAPPESFRAASALLLLAPETPLIFMGQEWAASSPFQYFTDHNAELGPLVSEGRLREFAHFPEFADPEARQAIPNPQTLETFLRSKLHWEERNAKEHSAVWRWYRTLLRLRRQLRRDSRRWVVREDGEAIVVEWRGGSGRVYAAISLQGGGTAAIPRGDVTVLFTSEDSDFAADSRPIRFEPRSATVTLERAGCAVLSVKETPGNE